MGWFGRSRGATTPAEERHVRDPTVAAFEREGAALRPDLPSSEAGRALMDAWGYLVADGDDLDMRVAIESRMLADLDPGDLADRLEHTPLPRIDPCPDDEAGRVAWIADVLRSERRDVLDGRVPLRLALAIAAAPRGTVPEHLVGRDVVMGDGPRRLGDEAVDAEARQVLRLPDQLLRHRFRHVPGAGDGIPPEHRPDDRLEWIRDALRAAETRELCGLAPARDVADAPMMAALAVGLVDVDAHVAPDGGLAFSGRLVVDGEPLCLIASPGDGTLAGSDWAPGTDARHLAGLDAYARSACAPREDADGGTRPTTLLDVLLDQVTARVATMAYREATVAAVLFCVDAAGGGLELLAAPVPDGGTREGAAAHVRAVHPEAVILDEMLETDAVLLWSTLA